MTRKQILLTVITTLVLFFLGTHELKGRLNLNLNGKETEIILTGDIMLGRTVMTKSLDLKDPGYPFRQVAPILRLAEIVFVNLENPIVTGCPRKMDGLVFCADPKMADGLVYAGVDVVTLANNHAKNYGQKGLDETVQILKEKGIESTGLAKLIVKTGGTTNFGFLGFEFIDKWPTEADYKLISESDKKVDVLIVGVHWGGEYQDKAGAKQRSLAQEMVKRGADVIVGHHPHWIQDIEYMEGKPVYYSLGNFVFDQMWSQKTREGLVIKLTFNGKELVKEERLSVYMDNWGQPEFKEKK